MSELLAIFTVIFVPLAIGVIGQKLLLSRGGIMSPLEKLQSLPAMVGRRWMVVSPLVTLVRRDDEWRYDLPISAGAVLEFCGWAGIDRGEPMASFMSPDLPEWIVFIPESKIGQWCKEIAPLPVVGQVKVRIVDDCDCDGEGE